MCLRDSLPDAEDGAEGSSGDVEREVKEGRRTGDIVQVRESMVAVRDDGWRKVAAKRTNDVCKGWHVNSVDGFLYTVVKKPVLQIVQEILGSCDGT